MAFQRRATWPPLKDEVRILGGVLFKRAYPSDIQKKGVKRKIRAHKKG